MMKRVFCLALLCSALAAPLSAADEPPKPLIDVKDLRLRGGRSQRQDLPGRGGVRDR